MNNVVEWNRSDVSTGSSKPRILTRCGWWIFYCYWFHSTWFNVSTLLNRLVGVQIVSCPRKWNNPAYVSFVRYRLNADLLTWSFLDSSSNGLGWCLPIIGLSSSSQIVGQNWHTSGVTVGIIGPVLPLASWTHIVTSYSSTNGVRLWVNGTLIGSTGPFSYNPSNAANTISLGNSPSGPGPCAFGDVQKGQFYGMMDEVRVYSRELTAAQIATLMTVWWFFNPMETMSSRFWYSSVVPYDKS